MDDDEMKTLESLDETVGGEIENERHTEMASDTGANPCPEGMHWDPAQQMCVPD